MKVYGYKDNVKGIMEIENTHTAFREYMFSVTKIKNDFWLLLLYNIVRGWIDDQE